jgi:RNA polymerase sigma factor (sigma-70 family)
MELREFEERTRPHLRRWRRIAFGVCADWATADDALQVALMRLARGWSRIQAGGLDRYATRAVVNAAIDELRRSHRRHEIPTDHREMPEEPPLDADPVPTRMSSAVIDALLALPPAQRRAVALRFLGDVGVAETAETLGVSPATVVSQTSRALASLRSAMEVVPRPLVERSEE